MNSTSTSQLIEAVAGNFLSYRALRFDLLVSICFLCDWKHLIEFNSSITDAGWSIEANRIRSHSVENEIRRNGRLVFEDDGYLTTVTATAKLTNGFLISSSQRVVCDHVFKAIENQSEFNIRRLVISTYPFNYSGDLDLPAISAEYINIFGKEYQLRASA